MKLPVGVDPFSTSGALMQTLRSTNEADSNMEPANVVDALCHIARAINRLAEAVEKLKVSE